MIDCYHGDRFIKYQEIYKIQAISEMFWSVGLVLYRFIFMTPADRP